jgi:tetratricopeptide (TPR) repeat protein
MSVGWAVRVVLAATLLLSAAISSGQAQVPKQPFAKQPAPATKQQPPAAVAPSKQGVAPVNNTVAPANKAVAPAKPDEPSAHGYKGKLIITRIDVTPAYGQSGEKPQPLPVGTVLLVREVRPVDGELYLQTMGGVLRARDVLLFEKAMELFNTELEAAEAAKKPLGPYYYLRGIIFFKQGEFDRASDEFTQCLATLDKPSALILNARAEARIEAGNLAEALQDCYEALTIVPNYAPAQAARGWALYEQGKYDAALVELEKAIASDSTLAKAYLIRSWIYDAQNKPEQAKLELEKTLELDPLSAAARNSLAWLQATNPMAKFYDPAAALRLARAACEWDAYRSFQFLDTLAVTQAATGDFAGALATQNEALKITPPRKQAELKARLALYQNKQPYVAGK